MLCLVLVAAVALLAPASAGSADAPAAEEGTARNAIDDALETFRNIILNGDPEKGIPVMDPLMIGEWDFAVKEGPLLAVEGSVSQVKVEGLGAFVAEQPKYPPMGVIPPRAIVAVDLRLPAVRAAGNFRLSGEAHTPVLAQSTVDAQGDFTMVVKDIRCYVKIQVTLSLKVKNVDVTLGLGDVFVDVQDGGKVGQLINQEAAFRIQNWFTENRSDMERQLADTVKKSMQAFLDKAAQESSSFGKLALTS